MQPTRVNPDDPDGDLIPNLDHSNTEGDCDRCGTKILRFRGQGDLQCHECGANYNCSGQRLRDDLHTRINRSEYDDDINDLEGDELSHLVSEREAEMEAWFDNR